MAIDLASLEDNNYLLDLLIQMEDVLDTLDTYVFENWFDSQIVDGPIVRRYWLVMTLKTRFRDMPDPRAAKRLVRQGVMVEYDRISGKDAHPVRSRNENPLALSDKDDGQNDGDTEKEKDKEGFWLIKISIPRRLVQEINAEEIEAYDEEIDAEDVQAANDQGIDDESAFTDSGEKEAEEDRQQEQEENAESQIDAEGSGGDEDGDEDDDDEDEVKK